MSDLLPRADRAAGAVNIPLFSDESRAAVGTDFKRRGRFEADAEQCAGMLVIARDFAACKAIKRGLQLAGPSFADFIDALQDPETALTSLRQKLKSVAFFNSSTVQLHYWHFSDGLTLLALFGRTLHVHVAA